MSVNLNPGFVYAFQPASSAAGEQRIHEPVAATPASRTESAETLEESVSRARTVDYVVALRELKNQDDHLKRDLASRTYLDIAHYDGGFHLIDVYT